MSRDNPPTDEQLISAHAAGCDQAFSTLYARYRRKVRNLSRWYALADSADVSQEIWLKVCRSARRFNPAASFDRWLGSIIRNAAFDANKKHRPPTVDPSTLDLFPNATRTDQAEQREIASFVAFVLDAIEPHHRHPLVMYYWIGMDCVAIAANAGIPVSTSTSRLQLARRAFRQAWLSHFDPY